MKRFNLLWLLLTFALYSCQNNKELTSPFSAEVLYLVPLNQYQANSTPPSYTIGKRTFTSLANFKNLRSPYYKIYRGGSVLLSNKEIVFKHSSSLGLRYRIVDNTAIPQDFSSLALVSAAYQFDYITNVLFDITNISINDIVNEFGPYELYFEASIQENRKGTLISTYEKQNAAYIPNTHKFLLFMREESEHVPLSTNLQVLAHEFGHSFWEYLFKDRRNASSCDRLDSEYAIAGLNEGFSDFLSYTITGSANILYNSIPSDRLARMRDFSTTQFTYSHIADIANESNEICDQSFYCIGTLFANALYKAQKNLNYNQKALTGPQGRAEFMKRIVPALQKTRQNFIYIPDAPPGYDSCRLGSNDTDSIYDGFMLGLFFNALLSQINDISLQKELCTTLAQNFEQLGFPSSLRKGYCL